MIVLRPFTVVVALSLACLAGFMMASWVPHAQLATVSVAVNRKPTAVEVSGEAEPSTPLIASHAPDDTPTVALLLDKIMQLNSVLDRFPMDTKPTLAPSTLSLDSTPPIGVPNIYLPAEKFNLTVRLVGAAGDRPHLAGLVIPKVAICFFGLVKHVDDQRAVDYANNLLRPLRAAGFDIEAFMHTYALGNTSYSNPRNQEAAIILSQNESIAKMTSGGILPELKHIELSDPAEADSTMPDLAEVLSHGNPWPENGNVSMRYYLRQLYSLMKVTEMWSNVSLVGSPMSQQFFGRANGTKKINGEASFEMTHRMTSFDCVVYVRPDLAIPIKLNMKAVHRLCSRHRRANLMDVALPRFEFGGYHDRFAFGTPAGMFLYGARGLMLRRYLQHRVGPAHAETFLKVFLCDNDVPVHLVPMYTQRVRAQGHLSDSDVQHHRRAYFREIVPSWTDWDLHSSNDNDRKTQRCAPISVWGE